MFCGGFEVWVNSPNNREWINIIYVVREWLSVIPKTTFGYVLKKAKEENATWSYDKKRSLLACSEYFSVFLITVAEGWRA